MRMASVLDEKFEQSNNHFDSSPSFLEAFLMTQVVGLWG